MAYYEYLRKSRADLDAEAHGEGETLQRHEMLLRSVALKMGIKIPQENIFREVVSGETIAARPAMQALLREVEAGHAEGVLVVEVERLARGDTIDQGYIARTFKHGRTKIITPLKVYDPENEYDEEYFEFGLFMSRREYKAINRRIQRGRIASANEGKWVFSSSPYGYRRIKLKSAKGYVLEPVMEEAEVVTNIYNWYADGIGMPSICTKLDLLGIRPAIGEKWSRASIRDILQNPVYNGKIRWGRCKEKVSYNSGVPIRTRTKSQEYKIFDGLHPAIINDSLFKRVQGRLKENQRNTSSLKNGTQNPLAGLILCSSCGHRMTRLAPNPHMPYAVMACPNSKTCHTVSSPLYLIEQQLLSSMRDQLAKYEIPSLPPPTAKESALLKSAAERQTKKLSGLNVQLDSVYSYFEQGVYSTDTFQERKTTIENQIEATTAALAEIKEQYDRAVRQETARTPLCPRNAGIIDTYEAMSDPAKKNQLLKALIKKVIYRKLAPNAYGKRNEISFYVEIFPLI